MLLLWLTHWKFPCLFQCRGLESRMVSSFQRSRACGSNSCSGVGRFGASSRFSDCFSFQASHFVCLLFARSRWFRVQPFWRSYMFCLDLQDTRPGSTPRHDLPQSIAETNFDRWYLFEGAGRSGHHASHSGSKRFLDNSSLAARDTFFPLYLWPSSFLRWHNRGGRQVSFAMSKTTYHWCVWINWAATRLATCSRGLYSIHYSL